MAWPQSRDRVRGVGIGRFEGAHGLRARDLMPIVASIGGNTGNQTMAIMIRALAVDQVKPSGAWRSEQRVARQPANGSVGRGRRLVALALYSNLALVVMTTAVVLNLVVAGLWAWRSRSVCTRPAAIRRTGRACC